MKGVSLSAVNGYGFRIVFVRTKYAACENRERPIHPSPIRRHPLSATIRSYFGSIHKFATKTHQEFNSRHIAVLCIAGVRTSA